MSCHKSLIEHTAGTSPGKNEDEGVRWLGAYGMEGADTARASTVDTDCKNLQCMQRVCSCGRLWLQYLSDMVNWDHCQWSWWYCHCRESQAQTSRRKRPISFWPTTISRVSWRRWCGAAMSTTASQSSFSSSWLSTLLPSLSHSLELVSSRYVATRVELIAVVYMAWRAVWPTSCLLYTVASLVVTQILYFRKLSHNAPLSLAKMP